MPIEQENRTCFVLYELVMIFICKYGKCDGMNSRDVTCHRNSKLLVKSSRNMPYSDEYQLSAPRRIRKSTRAARHIFGSVSEEGADGP